MTASEATQVCSRCDAPVSAEDLTQGLAIHLDGVPVCPNCIELLPVHVRLQINQVRASKGLAVTVYKMPHPRHPKLTLYTFSSAGMFTVHRRALRLTGTYDVRPLSHKSWYTGIDRLVAGRSKLLFAGGAVLAAGVVGLLLWTTLGDHRDSGREEQATQAAQPVPGPGAASAPVVTPVAKAPGDAGAPATAAAPVGLKRDDLPRDPWQAWEQVRNLPQAPPALIEGIGREVANRREAELAEIGLILDRDGPEAAERRLAEHRLVGTAPAFPRVAALESDLAARIAERRQAAALVPAPVTPTAPAVAAVPGVTPPPSVNSGMPPPVAEPPVAKPAKAMDLPPALEVPTRKSPSSTPMPEVLYWAAVASTGGRRGVPASLTDPMDPVVPSPWPLIADSRELPLFLHSEEERASAIPGWKGRQAVHLELPARQVAGGGVVLAVHAGSRLAKRELVSVVEPGQRIPVPLIFDGSWSAVVIPVEGLEDIDPATTVTIHLADADPSRTLGKGPFWLGPGLAVAKRPPKAADLALLPSVFPWDLVVRDARPRDLLVQLIVRGVHSRGGGSWQSPGSFNPWAIKVLCARKSAEWTTEMRQVLPRPLEVATLGNNTVDDFVLEPKWWTEHQLTAAKPEVDSKKFHVVCVIPNGDEAELTPERWAGQLRELTTQILVGQGKGSTRAGLLPVVVIGSVEDPGYTPGNWAKAREELERQGIPLIDLMVLPREGLSRKAWMTRSAQAIAHGLANLAYQIRWRQNKK